MAFKEQVWVEINNHSIKVPDIYRFLAPADTYSQRGIAREAIRVFQKFWDDGVNEKKKKRLEKKPNQAINYAAAVMYLYLEKYVKSEADGKKWLLNAVYKEFKISEFDLSNAIRNIKSRVNNI
jgi:hypothetical protein